MSQNPQQESQGPSRGAVLGLVLLVANAHATCVTVFTRSHFGVEALGVPGVAALVLMLAYGCLRAPEMFVYLGCWLVALIIQRIGTFRLVRQGWRAHSRYAGYPALAMRLPWVTERVAVTLIEPLLFRQGIEQEITRKRVQKMRDAEIEQRYIADRFREQVDDY
jgi:hypothetical protein